jgi:hypothetical protein
LDAHSQISKLFYDLTVQVSCKSKRNGHFTGFIFFTNLDGSFINGWRYQDGKITMSSSKKTKQRKISKRINMSDALSLRDPIDPEPVDCSSYTVVYEERYCIGDSGDNCTPWMYVGEDTYTYCTGGGGTSGGGIQYTTKYDQPAPETPPENMKEYLFKCIYFEPIIIVSRSNIKVQ